MADSAHEAAQEAVRIERYNPRWPRWADREIILLRRILGDRIAGLEHVGSTAVPGLEAKPTVDLMLGTLAWPWAPQDDARLLGAGYRLFEVPQPLWRFYTKPRGALARGFHLHVMQADSAQWHELLHFRDRLRTHPEEARIYVQTKKQLAQQFEHDRPAYQDAKAEIIEAILTRTVTPTT